LLVIPREHLESLDDASQKDEACWATSCASVRAWRTNTESAYRTVINTGAGAGQSVFHLHVHVLAAAMNWPPG
jgi:histidine triad (HIT) family protein